MILVDSRAVTAEVQAALLPLQCWVGKVAIWKQTSHQPDLNLDIPTSQLVTIEAETLDAATESFTQHHQGRVDLVIAHREHAAAFSQGALGVDGTESEALLYAKIVQHLILSCRLRSPGVIAVATMMKHSREEDLCRRGLLHLHPVEGVVYFPLRPGTPTQLQPPHEVLLVKATDYLDRLQDPEGRLSVAVAEPVQEAMEAAHASGKVVLDPLSALENILDRRTLRQKLPDLLQRTGGRVSWSEALEVNDAAAAGQLAGAMRAMLEGSDGVLCKPCVACGIAESHDMCLVRTTAGLPPTMPVHPFIVESVHNHSGVVFKCYTVNKQTSVHAKPSLPDVERSRPGGEHGSEEAALGFCRFHSITDMPCAPQDHLDPSVMDSGPVRQAAEDCSRVLAETTGLTVFGFDLVKPIEMENFVLVDVNAFPSFKGMRGAAEALRGLVVKSVRHSGRRM